MTNTKTQKVAYIRVSTAEQNTARQQETMKGMDKIFIDKLSGKDTNRPQLKACMDYLRAGDTLYISEYSRLARNAKDLLDINDMLKDKGVRLVSLKEKLDTDTPQGKLFLTFLSGMAEFERALILQRQKEGIALAKKAGKYKGRKKVDKPCNWQELYKAYAHRQITGKQLAEQCKVSRTSIYKWIKEEHHIEQQ
jgi:DNA invertase Pin-like site-specific DNA recombinase